MNRSRYNDKKKRRNKNNGGSKFKRGFYQPVNENKYRAAVDKTMNSQIFPEYRSSWELAFYKWCDVSDKIDYWGTESFAIPYISPKDNQVHRYYVDIVMQMKSGQKHLVEIKPKNQCNAPINLAKWEAARNYCKQINAIFTVVTEIELKRWGMIK